MRAWLMLILLCVAMPASAQSNEERRVALVIGVSAYQHVARLDNPQHDAVRVYEALVATRFSTPPPLIDPTKQQLEAALRDFNRRADNADAAVLYFAGHGMQQFDDNWLIPIDARLERPTDIRVEGIRLQDVVSFMGGARLRIIFLDACRNNPFQSQWPGTMTPAVGLTEIAQIPAGTVIAYSAGPRQQAPDNGVFARALSQRIREEGVELRTVLDRVRDDVSSVTPTLDPNASIAINTAQFYFAGGPPPDDVSRTAPGVAAFGQAVRRGTQAAYAAFLQRYPHGDLAALARLLASRTQVPAESTSTGSPACDPIRVRAYFGYNQYVLTAEAAVTLQSAVERWRACGAGQASVVASQTLSEHAEADGELNAAQVHGIFIRRAVAVRDALVAWGAPASSFVRVGLIDAESLERDPAERFVELTVEFD